MIKIVSFGDHLEAGVYNVHSRFKEVINFNCGNYFTFIVNSSIGGGPFNIVVDDVNLKELGRLIITEDHVQLNDEKILFKSTRKYNSEIEALNIDENRFKLNLSSFENALNENSPDKSLCFLLDEGRKKNFESSFEIEFVKRFNLAAEYFASSNYVEGTKLIKGVGFGLTPSGDDFISGFLIALNLCQKIYKVDYSFSIDNIYKAAKGNNIFTNVFLHAAKNGLMFEKFKNLLHSILHFGQNEIIEHTRTLISFGETSGADQGVGFLFGIKRNLK